MLPIFRGAHASWRCGEGSVPRCDAGGRGLRVPVPGPWRPPGKRRSAKSPVKTSRLPYPQPYGADDAMARIDGISA